MNEAHDEGRVRLLAFHLPQFHPIPENDIWWEKGFTEWTNVSKAKPLFPGHWQPRLPADLGFYDLRLPEARQAQADLARAYGIEGFCFWHYWFAGKRLLERPVEEMIASGEPDFPFCLAWANQSWTGVWHGAPDRILIEQTYPGLRDYDAHFRCAVRAFRDSRYITIDRKPVFVVFNTREMTDSKRFTDRWRTLASEAGLPGLFLIGINGSQNWQPKDHGFDGMVHHEPRFPPVRWIDKVRSQAFQVQRIVPYQSYIQQSHPKVWGDRYYPCVLPDWDNTPRSGRAGRVFIGSTPELFRNHLREAIDLVKARPPEHRMVFVKSWNEWAEGNYLEPDRRFGHAYLEVVSQEVSRSVDKTSKVESREVSSVG